MKLTKIFTTMIFVAALVVMAGFAYGATVRVNWNANSESDLGGYKVYYGTRSGTYANVLDVGNTTGADINSLANGYTYYFAVTAYDVSGNESAFSNEASILIPGDAVNDPDDPIAPDPSLPDSDMDGIPDYYEDLWGFDSVNPLDSLMDDDGDGVVNLVEYMAGTSPVDPNHYPYADNVLKDVIGEVGEVIDFSSVNPDGRYSIVPLTDAFPAPAGNSITPQATGAYLYNVLDEDSALVYRVRVSVTEQLTVIGDYEPGSFMELADQMFGIKIDLPANALIRIVPIGIGNVIPEAISAVETGDDALLFDILPFGLVLTEPAVITVDYDKPNPTVQRYDATDDTWVKVGDATAADGKVSFSTDELGTFKVVSGEQDDAPAGGGGGGGGGCFIQTAGF